MATGTATRPITTMCYGPYYSYGYAYSPYYGYGYVPYGYGYNSYAYMPWH
jgi:hypothetical protein